MRDRYLLSRAVLVGSPLTLEKNDERLSTDGKVGVDVSVDLAVYIPPVIFLLVVMDNPRSIFVLCQGQIHLHNTSIVLDSLTCSS